MMKIRGKIGKAAIAAIALAMCAAAALGPAALAAPSSGSLKVVAKYDGRNIDGLAFSVYQVASKGPGASLTFELLEPFAAAGLDINGLFRGETDAEAMDGAAAELAAQAAGAPEGAALRLEAPKLEISGLSPGVYLITQASAPAPYTASSFLVSIPMTDPASGALVYDVTARPKLDPLPEPKTDPETDPDPEPSPSPAVPTGPVRPVVPATPTPAPAAPTPTPDAPPAHTDPGPTPGQPDEPGIEVPETQPPLGGGPPATPEPPAEPEAPAEPAAPAAPVEPPRRPAPPTGGQPEPTPAPPVDIPEPQVPQGGLPPADDPEPSPGDGTTIDEPQVPGSPFPGDQLLLSSILLPLALAVFLVSRRARTVTFYVDGEQYGEPQKVTYGSAAKDPAPRMPGREFSGWDREFDKVKKDMDVHGTFEGGAGAR